MELMNCPSLAVPNEVMHHVVRVESSFNPYAIGVVGGRLARQPKTLSEALATVRMLESRGYNFSLGLAQVNRYNLSKYGLDSYEKAFQTCPNLQAGSRILAECYGRSSGDWGKSFSCYYSGNFVTGFRHGYVQKIYASISETPSVGAANEAIEVISKPSRRSVAVSRHPVYATGQQHLQSQRVAISLAPPGLQQSSVDASELQSGEVSAPSSTTAVALQDTHPVTAMPTPEAIPAVNQSTMDGAFVF
ncbi:lytic transglycosylase domain-containing protein [Lysobacter sp. CFH 32150]|uniref:lytic transglycosylase domain-containing protein n=1 Tax=Lysobacter sp. CFH 32150 TaxID=2927128 RepID=UPI0031F2EAC6